MKHGIPDGASVQYNMRKKKLITRVCLVTELPASKVDEITDTWITTGKLTKRQLKKILGYKQSQTVSVTVDWGVV